MPNTLTADVGVKVGPLMLETAFRHFLSFKHGSDETKAKDELLYDEAFNIVKVVCLLSCPNIPLSVQFRHSCRPQLSIR